jgi:hypothetical protein
MTLGIVAFTEKNAAENREKGKELALMSIDDRWKHRRNGPARISEMADIENRRVVHFENIQKINVSGRGQLPEKQ